MGKKLIKYTVSVYTEDSVGLLNRISAIFQKRHINIESFNSSMTEIENVQRWTILVITSESLIKKIVGQINKQIEVIKAYYHTDEETIYQESCLFKIKSSLLFDDRKIQNIIKESNAIIVTVNPEFFVIEKSGRTHELDDLYEKLNKYGILQYVRSARIAVTKAPLMISEIPSNLTLSPNWFAILISSNFIFSIPSIKQLAFEIFVLNESADKILILAKASKPFKSSFGFPGSA